jgi:hypothetical protein
MAIFGLALVHVYQNEDGHALCAVDDIQPRLTQQVWLQSVPAGCLADGFSTVFHACKACMHACRSTTLLSAAVP